jgi:hypothetical protein
MDRPVFSVEEPRADATNRCSRSPFWGWRFESHQSPLVSLGPRLFRTFSVMSSHGATETERDDLPEMGAPDGERQTRGRSV